MENKLNIEHLLPLVQRPARYINHEWNSHPAKTQEGVSVCLCFPDLYEVGASNLGLEILYHLVNGRGDARAERCYTPAQDMETLLQKENLPLFSLESRTPLKEFDIVGFSLQY
ncbi:MAG: B12-binding domain-containing radical SAM protein, partial [Endomicrobiales bacterium]